MRCELDYNEDMPFIEQDVNAWGELQSLDEEPCYKEKDIKESDNINLFRGMKYAFDSVITTLDCMCLDEEISEDNVEYIKACIAGELCMALFSILDEEYCEEK